MATGGGLASAILSFARNLTVTDLADSPGNRVSAYDLRRLMAWTWALRPKASCPATREMKTRR